MIAYNDELRASYLMLRGITTLSHTKYEMCLYFLGYQMSNVWDSRYGYIIHYITAESMSYEMWLWSKSEGAALAADDV